MDETALPSGVLGPRDLAPLMRACSDLDLRDIRLGTPCPSISINAGMGPEGRRAGRWVME
jgi:hypothetical protein